MIVPGEWVSVDKARWVASRSNKAPFAGPEQVLRYLSRYTHRVAISNRRLVAADHPSVALRWKDYRINGLGRWKTRRLHLHEFIRRFLMHVLPKGFHRIRHYGLFANANRAENIATARGCSIWSRRLDRRRLDRRPGVVSDSRTPTGSDHSDRHHCIWDRSARGGVNSRTRPRIGSACFIEADDSSRHGGAGRALRRSANDRATTHRPRGGAYGSDEPFGQRSTFAMYKMEINVSSTVAGPGGRKPPGRSARTCPVACRMAPVRRIADLPALAPERAGSVESRCGAVAVGRTYLLPPLSCGGASLARPWLCFHTPLIEPDVQISRIRLSDKTSRLRPRLAAPARGQAYEAVMPVEVREWISPAPVSPDLVLVAQPPAQPHGCVVVERPIRFSD